MSIKTPVHSSKAPAAIGPYSQAIVSTGSKTMFASGQIPLDSQTGELIEGNIEAQVRKVLDNMGHVAHAAGIGLDDAAKINVFLIDLSNFQIVNQVMEEYFTEPYPARAAVQVSALPKGAEVEMDAVFTFD